MAVTPKPGASVAAPRLSFKDTLAVYLKRRVLIVLFLGFSSGLPLALSGSTLLVWMTESRRQSRHHRPVRAGRHALHHQIPMGALDRCARRAAAVAALRPPPRLAVAVAVFADRGDRLPRPCDPSVSPFLVAVGALLVATASATQDIVIDAFRVESLDESEQAAGMASYVAAYRIGMLVSTAGALFLVSGFESVFGYTRHTAWSAGYAVMAVLVVVGIATTLVADEPEKSASADAVHAHENKLQRVIEAAIGAFSEFLTRDLAFVVLAFVVLFKFTDASSGAMIAPFVIDLGFSRNEYAAIIKGVGLAATLIGGFTGGFVARAFSLPASLWLGGVLQGLANLAFSWQALVGHNTAWLTFAITAENFTSAIGTVIFVAYLSALCRNPLHTATQYALLTALAAFGRTYLSSAAGFIAVATGWPWFFAICAVSGTPALLLLAWLQYSGHFHSLAAAEK